MISMSPVGPSTTSSGNRNSVHLVTGKVPSYFPIICLLIVILCPVPFAAGDETIRPVRSFGSNPGGIGMYTYVPRDMPANAPLVVSLHGCRQDAETYSHAGWKALADRWKFYLIFPEQSRRNNTYGCWNWFQAEDARRGRGEVASIVEMIEKMKSDYSIDDQRIFVEGLSAGGWLVPVLLASYPDLFAGGATNAGGPAFCASSERYWWDVFGWWTLYTGGLQAKQCMNGIDRSPRTWGSLVQKSGYRGYRGPWPLLSIWHGSADTTVDSRNQQELLEQWTQLHRIDTRPDKKEVLNPDGRIDHREYHDQRGRVLVETYLVKGMGHGTAIASEPEGTCGGANLYIIDTGICSVRQIGLFWGLNR